MIYMASLFFRSEVQSSLGELLESFWEESFVLVTADSEESAALKADIVGHGRSGIVYPTERGELTWVYVRAERIVQVDEPFFDGQEIFSRYLRAAEARSILMPFD
ncbi:DUF4288 domain-containing protein [Amantichitinum ursilacus]|uniref:DUF4288 domain-containing protein n=1 Tax=Amantichitinum ursilacus TaxID=857265 RepID=A0A0N0XIP1_9NEIS|nr:DUF4288 domain-containing protein [Amantichitinum ursilacus]KPC49931.1 hypothetical protein WG78_18785 [Amantichitinum ursilacus]